MIKKQETDLLLKRQGIINDLRYCCYLLMLLSSCAAGLFGRSAFPESSGRRIDNTSDT